MLKRMNSFKTADETSDSQILTTDVVENSVKGIRLQRLNTSSSKLLSLINDGETPNLFCLSVDGSPDSEFALSIISTEFLAKQSKLLLVHIYNEKKDDQFNYKFKKETVISNYSNKLIPIQTQSEFLIKDQEEFISHPLEQVNGLASLFKANYIVCGYHGIKGPKSDNLELSKGIDYLLGNSKIPVILIKNPDLRKDKKSGGYRWIAVFDSGIPSSIKALYAYSNMIDPEKDEIVGLTIVTSTSSSKEEEIKTLFNAEMKSRNIKNFSYESVITSSKLSVYITEKVNFDNQITDFLIFYNSRELFKLDVSKQDAGHIVKNSSCNICFYNY
jgi:hypothetical protein